MFAVLIPVGPGQTEVARLRDTAESLRAFEDPSEVSLVLVDDNAMPRDLAGSVGQWASCQVVRTALWRDRTPDPYSAMVAGTVEGMKAASRHDPEFLLKLDTDALVIAPVSDKLRELFGDERIGLVGSYTQTCTGARRDWSVWEKTLRRAMRPVALGPGRSVRLRSPRRALATRRLIQAALANGYVFGAHCLGGAYAVAPSLLSRQDLLDWRPWVGTWVSEDVVVGLQATAAGLEIRGSVAPGEVFALAWQDLPLPPWQLIERSYSVVHSVRDQVHGDEPELRAYFRSRRPAHRPA
jgi:hypothetical protein